MLSARLSISSVDLSQNPLLRQFQILRRRPLPSKAISACLAHTNTFDTIRHSGPTSSMTSQAQRPLEGDIMAANEIRVDPDLRRRLPAMKRPRGRSILPAIQARLFLHRHRIAAIYLGPTSQPRADIVSTISRTSLDLFILCQDHRARAYYRHPFCQDEKTLKASVCWIIGLTCRFLYCQWHCGQRIAPANRGYRFAHNKNTRRRPGGSGRVRRRPPPLNGIVPLGRIPNGTILRKRRTAT